MYDRGDLFGEGFAHRARRDDRGVREVDQAEADLLGGFLDRHDPARGFERGHEGREETRWIGGSREKIVDQLGALLPHLLHVVCEAPQERGEQRGE